MQTRIITNSGHPLLDSTGEILADVRIVFELVDDRSNPAGSFDVDGSYLAPVQGIATTSTEGEFAIELPCTGNLVDDRRYLCSIDHPDCPEFMAPLVYDAAPLPWVDFMGSGTTPPAAVVDPFTRHMQNTEIHTPTDTGHSHDNKETLDKLGESAGLLTFDGQPIASGATADRNIDGGSPDSVYLPSQRIDGGTP
jgi:hypothetical protein